MNWRVPRWVQVLLVGVAAAITVVGLTVERQSWATTHPFTVNLLSSAAGFSASLAFASLIVNRLARRQYWRAELDRRTRGSKAGIEATQRLALAFSLPPGGPVGRQLVELREALSIGNEDLYRARLKSDEVRHLEALTNELALLEDRLAFVSDGELLYRCDRLRRKWSDFAAALNEGGYLDAGQRRIDVEVVLLAESLETAIRGVIDWLASAPDVKMRRAVKEGTFSSALDDD